MGYISHFPNTCIYTYDDPNYYWIHYFLCLFLQWNWQTIVIGAVFLAFLLFAKFIVRFSSLNSSIFIFNMTYAVCFTLKKLFITGKEEEDVILGASNCPFDISHSVHSFRVSNSCRKERSSNSEPISSYFQSKYIPKKRRKGKKGKKMIIFISMQVNHIEKGLNPSSVHLLYLSGENLLRGFKIGAVAGMIALTVSLWSVSYTHLTLPTKRIV